MQSFSRVLAVFVAVASIVFMGFAGMVSFGDPNWEAQARSLDGYTFDQQPGVPPLWSATRAEGREPLSPTSPLLPEVLTLAIRDRTTRAEAERDRLAGDIPALKADAELLQKMQVADRAALDAAHVANAARLAETNQAVDALRKQQEQVATEAQKVEDQLESRRNDVFRLELQHRLLEADLEQIDQNMQAVIEHIRLIEDELDKARRRSVEFDARGVPAATATGEAPPAA